VAKEASDEALLELPRGEMLSYQSFSQIRAY